ncbi:hypothetical protein F0P96_10110 [Hymenobacter busanensis]|uniref:Uncharacterized protein n=1 Tax=Hymenobacter busanensis TaxID=2607656 RepID=A0A7L4ZYZ6_9BACT|nr:hypothetical protein [Hymenobacter busanensis]KAA9333316.1 hypothetical protein F0P96_10110 [Hymenobacter busanensis]QHJ08005.1 hypothetical protein GUY19_12200 [Hymenobacter busanensis]
MRKTTLIALATTFLCGVSCQKNDVVPTNSPGAGLSQDVAVACVDDVIDFNSITPGTLLNQATSTGGVSTTVSSFNPHYPTKTRAASVFRSSLPVSSTEDLDLRSPGAPYAVGEPQPNPGFENTVALGNIVVLQNFREYSDPLPDATPNNVNEPNDDDFTEFEQGGTIGFDFGSAAPITATSLTVIDVEFAYNFEGETGNVKLYASKGGAQIGPAYPFHDAGPNGVEVVSLGNTPGVGYIEVTIVGSMGIDNLRFCRPAPPTSHCTYTQGYWKNHPNAWPVQSLTLGGISYSKAQLITIFQTPVRGNGLLALAHQLIAAKLNVANGSSPAAVAADIAAADAMFVGKDLRANPQPSVPTSQTSALVGRLDNYNNGVTGPGHCDD